VSLFALPILLALACFLSFVASIRRVPEGSAFTVHRFGRYVRTLPPGIGFVLPVIERVGQRVSLINHAVPLGENASEGAVYYQILDPRRAGEALESIDQLVARAAQDAAAQFSNVGELRQQLNQRLGDRGLRVVRCELHSGSEMAAS
jgi:regulator of protease activity HflC (stomatin/prohibitin superfamily)